MNCKIEAIKPTTLNIGEIVLHKIDKAYAGIHATFKYKKKFSEYILQIAIFCFSKILNKNPKSTKTK